MSAEAIFMAIAQEAVRGLTPYALGKLGEAIMNTRASDEQERTAELAAEVTASRLSSIAIIRLALFRRKASKK